MTNPTLPLELTGAEVFLIEDCLGEEVTVSVGAKGDMIEEVSGREFLLTIGRAYNELCHPGDIREGPISIEVSEEDTWALRDMISSRDLGPDDVTIIGVGLLNKIYTNLLKFHAAPAPLELSWPVAEMTEIADRAWKECDGAETP